MPTHEARCAPGVVVVLGLVSGLPGVAEGSTLVVLNKAEATASLIDLDRGQVVATLPTGQGPHEVAVSPDGRHALVGNYGTVESKGDERVMKPGSSLTLIDVPEARVVKTIDLGEHQWPHGIVWLPGGREALVTAEGAKALLRVDVTSGKVVAAVSTDQEVSHMVALRPDGARAFVANIRSGTVTVIDLDENTKLGDVATGEGAEGIDVTADGRQVWVTNRGADTLSVLDAETLEILASIECASFPIRARATPDGKHVLVTNARSGDVAVFATETFEEVRRMEVPLEASVTKGRLFGAAFGKSSVPIGILIQPDGKRAFVAHANADVISVLDLESWKPAGRLSAGEEPDGLAFSKLAVRAGSGDQAPAP